MDVAVLMSGGIDSSFAAFHLKKQGCNVIALTFLQIGKAEQEEELLRVKNIAKILSIPHFVFNIKEIFQKEIINPFCRSFYNGETPNPCIFCNKKIKYGLMLKKAKELNVEKIAAGHYAKIEQDCDKRWVLRKAKDNQKDQSYGLWQLSQSQLSEIILPLGYFKKREVEKIIQKSELNSFFYNRKKIKTVKESQDICFLRGKSLPDFLDQRLDRKPGPILNLNEQKIGEHYGIHFFTIGQRARLGIETKNSDKKPLYVIKINREKNAVIVGREKYLFQKKLIVENLNWVSISPPAKAFEGEVKIRAHHKEAKARVRLVSKKNKAQVIFSDFQRAVTPGQHIVFYKKGLLLGGGIITKF